MADYQKLTWQEHGNFDIECELDIAVHKNNSKTIMLIVPGVDGSLDGYNNKYVKIAENAVSISGVAVVRMSNPFIGSKYWQSNVREALQFIQDNSVDICGHKDFELKIVGHSIGAYVAGQIAWEYPFVSGLLLINPATGISLEPLLSGLAEFTGNVHIIIGSEDPAHRHLDTLYTTSTKGDVKFKVIQGADHHFSGSHLETFVNLPAEHLF